MIDQAPPIEYQLQELAKFTDDDFKTKFPIIVNELWIERKEPNLLAKEQNITFQQLTIIFNLARTFINQLARSDISEKKLTDLCKSSGWSASNTKVFIHTLNIRLQYWRDMLNFTNIQDSFFSLQDIKRQNDAILHTMKEILKLSKGTDGSNTGHFQ